VKVVRRWGNEAGEKRNKEHGGKLTLDRLGIFTRRLANLPAGTYGKPCDPEGKPANNYTGLEKGRRSNTGSRGKKKGTLIDAGKRGKKKTP